MKEGIHPNYYQATVTCNCGNTFVTGSTKPEIHVEVCSKCHSFYTGQQKTAGARGRIEKFNKKYGVTGQGLRVDSAPVLRLREEATKWQDKNIPASADRRFWKVS